MCDECEEGRRTDVRDLQSTLSFPERDHTGVKWKNSRGGGSLFTFTGEGPFLSRPEYNGWPEQERRVPVAEVANLWAAPRLFRDLRAEEKCIALNKFMARPRLWSTRSSGELPGEFPESQFSSRPLSLSLSFLGQSGALRKRRSRLDTLSIYFLFVQNSHPARGNI